MCVWRAGGGSCDFFTGGNTHKHIHTHTYTNTQVKDAHTNSPHTQALESLDVSTTSTTSDAILRDACKAGIARCLMQRGDVRQGRTIALQLKSQQLYKECALILEG